MRKRIRLAKEQIVSDATLYLGCIIDADEVFVNGQKVGSTAYQYPPRIYKVPATLLKEGENVVVIRLMVDGAAPGFYADKPYKLATSQGDISLLNDWRLKRSCTMPKRPAETFIQWQPTGLYNNMIAPLGRYAISGVMWYQGESNIGKTWEYFDLMSILIDDWRNLWGRNDMPFVVVQLPNYMAPRNQPSQSGWAELRDQQLMLAKKIPNVALAVAIDVGEASDIHPIDKKSIGHRISLHMQRLVLGEHKIVANGPIAQRAEVKGKNIVVTFQSGSDNLQPNLDVKEVAVAGADDKYQWANAWVDGRELIIDCSGIVSPKRVRYAWADNPSSANLYNRESLPASPFQIDVN